MRRDVQDNDTMLARIEDSEDEGDLLSPVRPRDQAPTVAGTESTSADRSTDSTETQLRNATLDLIAPSPTITMSSSLSPAENRKRRNTVGEDYEGDSPAKKTKKSKPTRSQSSRSSQPLAPEENTHQDVVMDHLVVAPLTGDTVPFGTTSQQLLMQQALQDPATAGQPPPQRATSFQKTPSSHEKSSPMPWSAERSESRTQSTQSRPERVIANDGLNSDDIAVGIPVDQYKPRPSRSRSTQLADGAVDLTQNPDKRGKAKPKRRLKTVGDASDMGALPPPSPVRPTASQISAITVDEQMVIEPAVPQQNSEGSPSHAVLDNASPSDVIAVPSRASQPKAAHESSSTQETNVEVVIPKKTAPKTKASKARRSQTTIFEDHVGLEILQASPNLQQQQTTRKNAAKTKSEKAKSKAAEKAEKAAEKAAEETAEKAKDTITETPKAVAKAAEPITDNSTENVYPGDPPEKAPTQPQAPPTTKKAAPKEPHSPIKKGKTSFRVGLSKTQRIQPLLRIMRK